MDRQTHKQTQRQHHNILLPPTLEVELLFAAVARPALDIDCCMAHSRVACCRRQRAVPRCQRMLEAGQTFIIKNATVSKSQNVKDRSGPLRGGVRGVSYPGPRGNGGAP